MLSAAADARAADWVVAGVRDFDHTVGSIVPAVFEAYARVFHPASRRVDGDDVSVRWADVASANGRVMHQAAEWGSIAGTWRDDRNSVQPGVWEQPPATGGLPGDPARRLAGLLAEHTGDPEHCHFAVWDGHGVPTFHFFFPEGTPESARRRSEAATNARAQAWHALLDSAAPFSLPARGMSLLQGPLTAIEAFYEDFRDPPRLWWPSDRAWCVGGDVDLMTTYVGASGACVEALLADDELEALAVSVDQRITWDADEINPLPDQP
jgi:hypothetical protein